MRTAACLAIGLTILGGAAPARSDPMDDGRRGLAAGVALRGGWMRHGGATDPAPGLEVSFGRLVGPRTLVTARFASAARAEAHLVVYTHEIGLAARRWLRGWRLYVEPQLSLAAYAPRDNDFDPTPPGHLGLAAGLTAGAELVSRPHLAVDLRVSGTWMALRGIDDEQHLFAGLAVSAF